MQQEAHADAPGRNNGRFVASKSLEEPRPDPWPLYDKPRFVKW